MDPADSLRVIRAFLRLDLFLSVFAFFAFYAVTLTSYSVATGVTASPGPGLLYRSSH
jgi:hypothetical protein